jgi:hypothetical protein
MKLLATLGLTAVLVCGCSPQPTETTPEGKAEKPPSTLKTMVDGATGAQAVRSGTKASNQIRSISAARESDLNDIMAPSE